MRSILILVVMLWTVSLVAAERSSDRLNQIRVLPQPQQNVAQAYYAQIAGRTSNWEQNLFPPELVMRHRAELELTDKQRSDLIAMIQQFQSAMVPVEWELQDAKVELEKILAKYPTPEKAVEQALDNVFIHEAQIKLRHILMLVKVKNVLNQTQIDYLQEKTSGNRFTKQWYRKED